MKKLLLALPFAVLGSGLVAAPARAEDEKAPVAAEAHLPWLYDIAKAKDQAAKEKKDLFILFTGSDWCHWCKVLDSEVLSHASFVDKVSKDFVYLFLDFPNGEEAKAKVVDAAKSRELSEHYGVQGYPSAILALPDGVPYARTGYRKGGPDAYAENLAELRLLGTKVKALSDPKARGDLEKLKEAMTGLAEQEMLGVAEYGWMLDLAEKKDADGTHGLKAIVVAEREKKAAADEEKVLQKLLEGVQTQEEIPFEKVHEFLKGATHLHGETLLNWCALVGDWLLEEGKPAEAKVLYERALADPLCAQYPEAKQQIAERIAKAEKALEPGSDGEDAEKDAK